MITIVSGEQRIPLNGTLTGTLSGSALAVTLNMPSFAAVGAPAGCAATGTGTAATATTSSLSAVLTLTYTAPCIGSLTTTATNQQQITLTK